MEHIQTLGLQVAPFDEKQKNGLPLVTLESKTPSALGKRDSAIARIGPIPMKLPLVPPPVPYSPQSTISSGSSCDGGGGEEKRKRKSVPFKMVGGVPVKKRRFQYRYHWLSSSLILPDVGSITYSWYGWACCGCAAIGWRCWSDASLPIN